MGSNVAEENGKSYSEGEEYGHTWPCSGRERVKEQRPSFSSDVERAWLRNAAQVASSDRQVEGFHRSGKCGSQV